MNPYGFHTTSENVIGDKADVRFGLYGRTDSRTF